MGLSRRGFLKLFSASVAGLFIAPSVFLVLNNEVNEPVVKRVNLPIRNLPASFQGFRVAVMTDFHLYPFTQPDLIQKAVAMANSLKPDLGVFLGDYVWQDQEAIFDLAPILAKLNPRYGIYGILGNHDYWLDIDVVKQGLREAGIPILINQGVNLANGKGSLNIVGLDDGWSGHPDLNAAFAGLPAKTPSILLIHEPDLADRFSLDSRLDVQLSGHSHGGQVRINGNPFILPYLGQKYDFGLYRVKDMWVYTNTGLGVISVPVRYNCPPEITLITLASI